ncbi:hypothetical protein GRX01_09320 [Halobaculum sp. WSA2]|uniref:Uncharacterized protein n=1 Tax=Halobaculum saliterrae TaxID=2073113 RepID=A0A6B0SV95_9EURY|nr:hypothetical protein [Halobaculum saliterrae]MXR41536.1 hypothetical protein [Halobaculum saliterrae]
MRRAIAVVTLAVLVSLAGCSAAPGGGSAGDGGATEADGVVAADASTGASDVEHTVRFSADESDAGSEWESLTVEYPREHFTVDSVSHGDVTFGVDTNGDGDVDREFNESAISGVNNNDYSFTLSLDTDYTLDADDTVVVRYPAVDNPDQPGEYEISVTLNGARTTTETFTVG